MHKRSNQCRDDWGVWDTGGGRLEWGEDLYSAVLREVKEEYCVDGIIQEQLPPYCIFRESPQGEKTHWLGISHIVLVDRSKVMIGEPHKMEELSWFSLDQLPNPLHRGIKLVLDRYGDHLRKYS